MSTTSGASKVTSNINCKIMIQFSYLCQGEPVKEFSPLLLPAHLFLRRVCSCLKSSASQAAALMFTKRVKREAPIWPLPHILLLPIFDTGEIAPSLLADENTLLFILYVIKDAIVKDLLRFVFHDKGLSMTLVNAEKFIQTVHFKLTSHTNVYVEWYENTKSILFFVVFPIL